MAFYGSPFDAQIKNGRVEGIGKYTFPDGHVYQGEIKDGMFHGKGTILFKNGGRYDAEWKNGLAVQGKYTFADGLEYDNASWDYCTETDRRFYTERVEGLKPAGRSNITNSLHEQEVKQSSTTK